MSPYLVEAYHSLRVLVPAGAGWTILRWGYKRWQKFREDLVLSTFHNTEGPWQSAHGVVGELYLKAALSDAPGFFPPRRPSLKHRFRVMFYRTRHFLRRVFLPSKGQADKILRTLWERKLLERAGWDHTDNEFYKLKTLVG
ncbi:MAG TPA: hypothetical protein VN025_05850 [Candidatus Dormibacteraeota bacterium]|jgi:hypothetical protein|nr:hypothetical protein [Candidatus Dormibacteraeota bacterium]